ncbi:hypothetical protein LJC63_06645 [Ruminococcaceae bacterium OttesenSCG-928-L11]|nr:hypothetical protein [Ruminococcaceae bacterium OttesenSCG-928-L11]
MTIGNAKRIAAEWVGHYAETHPLIGAVLHGSIVDAPEADTLPSWSDLDLLLVMEPADVPLQKPGKLRHRGVLLEASVISITQLTPPEQLLSTYEIAPSFRHPPLWDPSGRLEAITATVSRRFAEPRWVQARCDAVYAKIRSGIQGYRRESQLLDTVNPWLFPAGICAHAVLVAARRNPTVRLRCLRAREVLAEWGALDLYDAMLALLGCDALSSREVANLLQLLEPVFDKAAALRQSPFPFQSDISADARFIAIDGSRQLIESGHHREAVFWIAVTWERCMRILRADAPEEYRLALPGLQAVLDALGAGSPQAVERRLADIEGFLPVLQAALAPHIHTRE